MMQIIRLKARHYYLYHAKLVLASFHYEHIDRLRRDSVHVSELAMSSLDQGKALKKTDQGLNGVEYIDQCQPVFFDIY